MRFYIIGLLVGVTLFALLSLALPLFRGVPEKPIGPEVVEVRWQGSDPIRGEALYRSKCYGCHAPEAGIGPAHNTVDFSLRYASDEAIAQVVRAGRQPMPAFNETMLNEQELADIIAYLRSLNPQP
jgi:mono/diheme cytochrome c family protein